MDKDTCPLVIKCSSLSPLRRRLVTYKCLGFFSPEIKFTSPIVINVPNRDLLAVEIKASFVLWLPKF